MGAGQTTIHERKATWARAQSGLMNAVHRENGMGMALTEAILGRENREYSGSGGRSQENHTLGFRPAFMDTQTRTVYVSCFADGQPAPFHLLDGLPDDVVLCRQPSGKVVSVKASVVSGFVFEGDFLTRDEAAARVARYDA